jgi:formate/nitrite transporter FocA (FNT family)
MKLNIILLILNVIIWLCSIVIVFDITDRNGTLFIPIFYLILIVFSIFIHCIFTLIIYPWLIMFSSDNAKNIWSTSFRIAFIFSIIYPAYGLVLLSMGKVHHSLGVGIK